MTMMMAMMWAYGCMWMSSCSRICGVPAKCTSNSSRATLAAPCSSHRRQSHVDLPCVPFKCIRVSIPNKCTWGMLSSWLNLWMRAGAFTGGRCRSIWCALCADREIRSWIAITPAYADNADNPEIIMTGSRMAPTAGHHALSRWRAC